MQFRKNPVTIEAKQFVPPASAAHELTSWMEANRYPFLVGDATKPETLRYPDQLDGDPSRPDKGIYIDPATGELMIRTLEGDMRVSVGDWVILGVQGEFYPCKPDIFAETYTAATDPVRVPLGNDVIITDGDEDAVRLIVARHVVQRRVPRSEGEGYELTPRAAQLVSLHAQQWVHTEDGEVV